MQRTRTFLVYGLLALTAMLGVIVGTSATLHTSSVGLPAVQYGSGHAASGQGCCVMLAYTTGGSGSGTGKYGYMPTAVE